MGNSPKLMSFYSSLFSDHIENVVKLVVYTAKVPVGERYTMRTPNKAWMTMVATWNKLVPERIIEDVMRFRDVIDKIIVEDGVYLSDQESCGGLCKEGNLWG